MDDQLDPLQKVEIALLRAEHQKRYSTQIAFVKQGVGEGNVYQNAVVKVVTSDAGAYYEMNDIPEEFSGAISDRVEKRFVAPKAGLKVLEQALTARGLVTFENTRQLSIFAVYTRRGIVDRKGCYIYEYRADHLRPKELPREVGKFQPGVIPLFFKIKIDSTFALDALGIVRGVIFCMANAGDRNLLVTIPYDGEQVTDLGNMPTTNTIH